ncbi:hypothetical protein MKX03_021824 [Papaver bracteatum]|nr:hypothetical protein MKX03_021824 [Papaver bracteatum]
MEKVVVEEEDVKASELNQVSPTMAATCTEIEQSEVQVAEGYTITHFHDKINDVFLNEKPQTKDWRKLLVFREECKRLAAGCLTAICAYDNTVETVKTLEAAQAKFH